ncbi:MAG: nucleotidyltransferase domain-containing protein [Deltaproteobacteria bacterium]|nr:nucleotidyltransferase domain-containing protein [Deltaproteobacteria bacterium]
MNSKTLQEILLKASSYRILSFLTLHTDRSHYDKEIAEQTGVSRGATNQILNDFLRNDLVSRDRRGRMWFYTVNPQPLISSFRVFENLVFLQELVKRLGPISRRIILFGSAAQGTDSARSDIDLFVITETGREVVAEIRRFPSSRPIKPVIMNAKDYASARMKDKVFIAEVQRGLILYDEEHE